jgi:quercetin dioxygenase-like cupin family protein
VQVLSDIGDARLVLFTFKAGQQLKEHRTTSQILVQVLRGRVTFATAGNSVKLQAGMVLQLEENVSHSILAQTDAVMLITMTPSPSFHSPDLSHSYEPGQRPLVTRTASTQVYNS